MRILIVLTSHDRLGNTGRKTGFWFEELAAPYFVFRDAGVEITLASPKGGQPPLDPKSNEPEVQTDDTRRFEQDPTATRALTNTVKLSDIDQADYDSVFFPGGHGPLWDLTNDRWRKNLWRSFAMPRESSRTSRHRMASLLRKAMQSPGLPIPKKPPCSLSKSFHTCLRTC
jgi:hypothetical protein